jgi:RNA polymerase sigma-70 factor (ECF subfamily)
LEVLDYKYLAELVTRAQKGDSNAFAELYAATYQRQYRYSYRYLRDESLAQDALQETFVRVLKNINTLRDPYLFAAWLNRVNFRVCYDIQRKRGSQLLDEVDFQELELFQSEDGQPEDDVIRRDNKEYIMRQIMNLPLAESQAVLLKFFHNMTLDEIAEMLNVSRSSVKRYLKSGKERLQLLLKDMR